MSEGGTKEARTMPCEATSANHSASLRSLPSRDVLDVLGVAEPQLIEEPFEGVVDRLPIDAGGFHGDRCHLGLGQPSGQFSQSLGRRGKGRLRYIDRSVRLADPATRHDLVTVNVESGNLAPDLFHCCTSS
jgi:hypothetical protein